MNKQLVQLVYLRPSIVDSPAVETASPQTRIAVSQIKAFSLSEYS